MGEGRLGRCQHHGRHQPRPEQFSPHWRKGTGSPGTFSGHRTTLTTMRTNALRKGTSALRRGVDDHRSRSAAGAASAHIDPDPLAMEAGTSGTVGFNVEHGCERFADDGPQDPDPGRGSPMSRWSTRTAGRRTVTGDTIEFKGGPLDADKPDHFDVTLTVPDQAGDLHFPAIETCEKGEMAWIEIAAEGAPEPELPAPTSEGHQGPPTSADLTPPPEAPDDTPRAGRHDSAPVTRPGRCGVDRPRVRATAARSLSSSSWPWCLVGSGVTAGSPQERRDPAVTWAVIG